MNLKEGFNYAIENERLVHGALKKVGVSFIHPDYEDLLQEGLITFAKMVRDFGIDYPNLHLQVFQRIKWQTIDFLRRDQKINERNEVFDDYDFSLFYENKDIDFWLMIQELSQDFSQLEMLIFKEHLLNGVTLSRLARENPLSLRQLHRVKKGLISKLFYLTKP